jgi:hypothetical protein
MSEYMCLDEVRARDILRTHVCAIFDFLKENYGKKLSAYHWEQEIADEALQITLTVWDSYNVSPPAWHWTDILRKAIVLHLGRPLGGTLKQPLITPMTDSPLLIMAKAARRVQQIEVPKENAPTPVLATELARLLIEARHTPESIADIVDINWRTVYRHKKGELQPSLKNVAAYEKALTKLLNRKITLPTPVRRQNATKTPVKSQ